MDKTFLEIRKQFPLLSGSFLKKPVVYLDSSATTQKPKVVIDRLVSYYSSENANIHRGPYSLSMEATTKWQEAHEIVANFINANSYKEVIFVRNATEGLNLLVNTVGKELLKKDDIVVLTEMEHHSNIVPWLMLQEDIGFKIEYIPIKDDYTLDIKWFEDLVKKEGSRVKIVSVVHISNVLGIKNEVESIFKISKKVGSFNILDVAQSIARIKVDVKSLGCDALVFSGHKVYGPTGSGVVYIKMDKLKNLKPWMGGGEMISSVTKTGFELNELPWRFEAGTPDIADGIALGTAIEWLDGVVSDIGWEGILSHEQDLIHYMFDQFFGIDWFIPFGPIDSLLKYGAVAFNIKGFSFSGCKDLANIQKSKEGDSIVTFLNGKNIGFREGFHCAEPLHDRFGVGPTVRFSFGIYSSRDDVKQASNALKQAVLRGLV
jgi:cysteine desulfurase/selenocysteine lyase